MPQEEILERLARRYALRLVLGQVRYRLQELREQERWLSSCLSAYPVEAGFLAALAASQRCRLQDAAKEYEAELAVGISTPVPA